MPRVGRVAQHLVDRGGRPERSARGRRHPPCDQPLGDAVQGQAVFDVPGEDLAHHRCLMVRDPQPGRIAGPERVQAVAEGRRAPGQQAPGPQCGQPTASHAVGDDRPLVLGDRPTDLDDQRVLRIAAGWALQEHHLAAGVRQLFEQPDLVGVAPGEPIGTGDEHQVHVATRHGIAETVQGGPIQPRPAVPVIPIDPLVRQGPPLLSGIGPQALHLLLDRLRLGLPLRRDARIAGYSSLHHCPPAPRSSAPAPPARRADDSLAASERRRLTPRPTCGCTEARPPLVAAASRTSSAPRLSSASESRPTGWPAATGRRR